MPPVEEEAHRQPRLQGVVGRRPLRGALKVDAEQLPPLP